MTPAAFSRAISTGQSYKWHQNRQNASRDGRTGAFAACATAALIGGVAAALSHDQWERSFAVGAEPQVDLEQIRKEIIDVLEDEKHDDGEFEHVCGF